MVLPAAFDLLAAFWIHTGSNRQHVLPCRTFHTFCSINIQAFI